jgi:hypothetical protein
MPKKSTPEPKVYQIKVTLQHIEPPIWRRIEVPRNVTLRDLHEILQIIMGWKDKHKHTFTIKDTAYGPAKSGSAIVNERQTTLNSVLRKGAKFTYEYDPGASWQHMLVVEQVLDKELEVQYPRCIAGERAGPPEDVGGPIGYMRVVMALADPDDEANAELLGRLGEDYDPEEFDVDAANKALAR